MILKKLVIVVATLLPAACLLGLQHRKLVEQKGQNEQLLAQVQQLRFEAGSLTNDIPAGEAQLAKQRLNRDSLENRPSAVLSKYAASRLGTNSKNLTDFVRLSKTNLSRFHVKPLTDDNRLSDEAAAILGMSETEHQQVDQALTNLVSKHEQLDLSKVTQVEEHLTSEPGRKTTFRVSAYPEEGKALASEFMSALQTTLGPTRTDLLLNYAALDTISGDGFEPFGRTEKTITFLDRYKEDGSRGDCRIFLKVVDSATGFHLSTGFPNVDEKIPAPWRGLIQNITSAP